LQISPEVAQQRKPEHKWHLLEAKSQALANLVDQQTSVIHIQAEQSVEQVMLEVKRALWRLL